jgi:hypothetical protein
MMYMRNYAPYTSLKNIAKCAVSEVFPMHILQSDAVSGSDNDLEMATCLVEPDIDVCDICVRERVTRETLYGERACPRRRDLN